MDETEKPVIVLGAGGHAKVVVDALLASGRTIVGLTDRDANRKRQVVLDCPILGDDDEILKHHTPEDVWLANGVGSTGNAALRRAVFEQWVARGYVFPPVVHPSALVARDVRLDAGAQVMAGTILQPGCHVGANAIVNTGAQIDHDGVIGAHVHISPGAVLCGMVTVGDGAHVGAGAVVIQTRHIGPDSLVAAGATVVEDVAAGRRVAGVPAKPIPDRDQ